MQIASNKPAKSKGLSFAANVLIVLGLILILIPLYLTVITALKTKSELLRNFFALPQSLYLGNFQYILSKPDYYYAIGNSLMITGCALAVMLVMLPTLSFALSRGMKSARLFRAFYYIIIAGIFVPFQVRMLPLMKLMTRIGLMNRLGIIILYIATSTCEGTFLYVGFLAHIPQDLEEAAYIDGASTNLLYWRIIYPLMLPITATVMIKNGLWIWNDFMMPLIMLNKSAQYHTITLFQHAFKTAYTADYTLAFATFIMSILPIMLLYVFCQKYIIAGLTNGAVKG